jgi:hypothetical protein
MVLPPPLPTPAPTFAEVGVAPKAAPTTSRAVTNAGAPPPAPVVPAVAPGPASAAPTLGRPGPVPAGLPGLSIITYVSEEDALRGFTDDSVLAHTARAANAVVDTGVYPPPPTPTPPMRGKYCKQHVGAPDVFWAPSGYSGHREPSYPPSPAHVHTVLNTSHHELGAPYLVFSSSRPVPPLTHSRPLTCLSGAARRRWSLGGQGGTTSGSVTATAAGSVAKLGADMAPQGAGARTARATRDRKNFASKVLNMVFHRSGGGQGQGQGTCRSILLMRTSEWGWGGVGWGVG